MITRDKYMTLQAWTAMSSSKLEEGRSAAASDSTLLERHSGASLEEREAKQTVDSRRVSRISSRNSTSSSR